MAKTAAERQRDRRERLKNGPAESYARYKAKDAQRKRLAYVPQADQKARTRKRIRVASRLRKRAQRVREKNERSANNPPNDNPGPSHQRVSGKKKSKKYQRIAEKMYRDLEKKCDEALKSRAKYKKRCQRMRKQISSVEPGSKSGQETPQTTPRSAARSFLLHHKIPPKNVPKLRKALVFQNVLENELSHVQKNLKKKLLSATSGKVIKKYRCISKFAEVAKVSWRRAGPDRSKPRKIRSDALLENQKQKILDFLLRDDNSKTSPQVRDVKVNEPKRFLCDSLKNLWLKFQQEEAGMFSISYNSFRSLKPSFVVAPTEKDRLVCLCLKHENAQLKLDALSRAKVTALSNVEELVSKTVCSMASSQCMDRSCSNCGVSMLDTHISAFDQVSEITVKSWSNISEPNSQKKHLRLTETSKTVGDIYLSLCRDLDGLSSHIFNLRNQFSFVSQMKEKLPENWGMIQVDFAENYTCQVAREPQSHYYARNQITVHPFMVWVGTSGGLVKRSYAVISDELKHWAPTFVAFQKLVLDHLKSEFPSLVHVLYLSDGAGGQYKNKSNFFNLSFHKLDHGISAEWHFFVSGHGKGPCDGIGAVVKKIARDLVLKKGEIVSNSDQFLRKVQPLTTVHLLVADAKAFEDVGFMIKRWEGCKSVPKTQSLHQIRSFEQGKLWVSELSCSCCDRLSPCGHLREFDFKSGSLEAVQEQPSVSFVEPIQQATDPIRTDYCAECGDFFYDCRNMDWYNCDRCPRWVCEDCTPVNFDPGTAVFVCSKCT